MLSRAAPWSNWQVGLTRPRTGERFHPVVSLGSLVRRQTPATGWRALIDTEPILASMLSVALFWAAAIMCAVAQVAIVRAAARTPRDAGAAQRTSSAPPTHRAVEVAWTLIPAAALALVLLFTWRAVH